MKLTKSFVQKTLALIAIVAVGGCYSYKPVPKSTLSDSFTHREKDASDKLLDGIEKLTLAQAQRIALKNNPSYIAAHHAIEAARFRYYQAMGAWLPSVKASFSLSQSHSWTRDADAHGKQQTNNFSTDTGLRASWLLFDGLAREFSIKAQKSSVEYQKEMDADHCRRMMYAVAQAYNNVLLAIAQRRIAEENRKFQQISLKDTNYKFQAGAVPLSDVLNFEILMNGADVDMITADYNYEISLYALAVLMGYPEGTLPAHIKFPIDLDLNFHELPAVEIYLDAALANRPDLKAAREQLQSLRYSFYGTLSKFGPTATANYQLGYSYDRGISHDKYGDGHSWSSQGNFGYALNISWNLFNGFSDYFNVKAAQAQVSAADYMLYQVWLSVITDVRTAYENHKSSIIQAKLAQDICNLTRETRDLVENEYNAGTALVTRLNEAERDLVQAQNNLATAVVNIANTRAQLDAAIYAFTPAEETTQAN